MKTESKTELPTFERRGNQVRINFDHRTSTKVDDGVETTYHVYYTAEVSAASPASHVIEAVIHAKYPTYGAELAEINAGGERYDQYQADRATAKQLAADLRDWMEGK